MTEIQTIDQSGASSHGKKVYGVFALILIVVIMSWLGTMQWKQHLTVTGIIVDGEHILSKEELVKLAQISLKTRMYDVDLTAIQNNIVKNHFVKNVEVTRDAPSTIRIEVEERTPIALLSLPANNDLLYIDDEGYILPHISSQAIFDLPVISGVDSITIVDVGQPTAHPDVLGAVEALETARRVSSELFHMISEVRIRTGHDMVLYSADTGIPIIFGRGDAAKKMVKLDAFWKKFITDQGAQNIRYIDVRYEDQVIISSPRGADQQTIKKSS